MDIDVPSNGMGVCSPEVEFDVKVCFLVYFVILYVICKMYDSNHTISTYFS